MKKALVLCATVPHTLLIEKLKQRGYFVCVADMNPKAPAVPCADEFVPISAFNKEAIAAYAKENNIDLVISSCSEQARRARLGSACRAVSGIPALFMVKDGKVVASTVGYQPKEQLIAALIR